MGNRAAQETSSSLDFMIFRCQKYVKKGYIKMTKKVYLETLKSVLGSFISQYFTELVLSLRQNKFLVHRIHGDRKINTRWYWNTQ